MFFISMTLIMINFELMDSLKEWGLEGMWGVLVSMLLLLKFLNTNKMFIMFMSLEMMSVFLYMMFINFVCGSISMGLVSLFLVTLICEGVIALLTMMNIYQSSMMMIKSTLLVKF